MRHDLEGAKRPEAGPFAQPFTKPFTEDAHLTKFPRRPARRLPRLAAPAALAAGLLALGGCAAPVIGALTVSQLSTAAGVASSIMSGRSPAEHLVSAIAGEDCRFLEAVLRGRPICVPYGSAEAQESFQGIIVALNDDAGGTQAPVRVAGLDPDAVQLGFAPILPDYAIETGAIAAVEKDIQDSRRGDMRRVSFGMLSATFGPSHSMDDLLAERDAAPGGLLSAAPGQATRDPAPRPAPVTLARATVSGTADAGMPALATGPMPLAAAPMPLAATPMPLAATPMPLAATRSDGAVIEPELPASRHARLEVIVDRARMAPIPD